MKSNIISKLIQSPLLFLVFISLGSVVGIAAVQRDYDGDGKSDLMVGRSSPEGNFLWFALKSKDGFSATVWGLSGGSDVSINADYDGDGSLDIAVIRRSLESENAYWYILNSSTNTMTVLTWGLRQGDTEVPQDYDGDGRTDIAVYRYGWWYILRSSDNLVHTEQFGLTSNPHPPGGDVSVDYPFAGGDYDGDGKADLAVARSTWQGPSNPWPRVLYLRLSETGHWASYDLGDSRFTGVLRGDYDGDGKADVAVW